MNNLGLGSLFECWLYHLLDACPWTDYNCKGHHFAYIEDGKNNIKQCILMSTKDFHRNKVR